jgi:hypothetical protein
MQRREFSLSIMGAAVLALTGCGGGDDEPVPVPVPVPAGPELASVTALPALTAFLQSIVPTDGDGTAAPGQANIWDLEDDFSLDDGYDDQFDGALEMSVDVGGNVESFPSDQTYAELTAFGPELGAADGVKLVSFTNDPDYVRTGLISAVLHAVPDSRLQQTLNLAAAVAPITLTWVGSDRSDNDRFGDEPYFLQVVVRSVAGALLATIFRDSSDLIGNTGAFGTGDLSAFAGQSVVLSFEQRSSGDGQSSVIDDVSVTDNNAVQFVTNGNFEAGGTGWTVPDIKIASNVVSGMRMLNGLEVRRNFFAQPNALWGRWVDMFRNPTASAINATVIYDTNLGSDDSGIIYDTPGAIGKAITTWDGDNSDRDIGMVFGNATQVTFLSEDGLGNSNGSDGVEFRFNISVPAGGLVSIVNFIIMDGTDTADTAADITARATAVDTLAADIANNFRTSLAYRRGMAQEQLDSAANF